MKKRTRPGLIERIKNMDKEKKSIHFLWSSMIFIIILSMFVFASLANFMIQQSRNTVTSVVNTYMEGMNGQILRHFETLVNMRMLHVRGFVNSVPPTSFTEMNESTIDTLARAGQARDFTHLSLYNADGYSDLIYGDNIEIVNKQSFLREVNNGHNMVGVGKNSDDETVLIYGYSIGEQFPEGYPLSDGSRSMAVVIGLPIQNLSNALALDDNYNLIYSHIIQQDGMFISESDRINNENCYEWLLSEGTFSHQDTYSAVYALKSAVEQRHEFRSLVTIDGISYHLYCSPIQNTEWSMLSIMPHSIIDEAISGLGTQRIWVSIISCVAVLIVMLAIFFIYIRMMRSQMKELKAARIEAEHANKAKSEFLSNMSHDIRTPMNAIVGMTAIAQNNIDDPDQVADCLRKISMSSKHLLGLINDVLDMSKIESGKLSLNMDLMSLRSTMESITNIVQPQIKSKKQIFNISIHDIKSENVYCDGVRLNQVLINLLSNAIKFTPDGGRIDVQLYQESSPKGDKFVRSHFVVKDNGIGMSKDFQNKIFNSFEREDRLRVQKTEGTGLGMAITKYIVDAMEGSISLKSEPNKGSEFHVTIDLERLEGKEEDMTLPIKKVLIVDDDTQLCKSISTSLAEMGVESEWATDGETAVDMVELRHSSNEGYDLILLDWKMHGMSGIEAAKEIRPHVGNDIPIIMISSCYWRDIEDEATAAGVNGFISKPLFKSTLYYSLRNYAHIDDAATDDKSENDKPMDFTGFKLLVAEDNDLNWEIANELLSMFGFEMTWAMNGQICVDKFLASEEGYYDAVLMDLRMPVMNGFEATKAIRDSQRHDSDIPIIAMTADAFDEDIKKCIDAGMNAHISKPIDIKDVIALLQKYMRKKK